MVEKLPCGLSCNLLHLHRNSREVVHVVRCTEIRQLPKYTDFHEQKVELNLAQECAYCAQIP